jgi:AcrR family transcriptional regulator
MKPDSKVSEKIVDRTIYLMGKKGSADLTVRDIANEASVNTAAVNYYFDSKDQLFTVVEERFAEAFGEIVEKLQDTEYAPEERLFRWADEIMGYLVDYPGVLNLVSRLVSDPDQAGFGAALQSHIEACFHGIRNLIKQMADTDDEELLDFKAITLTSALAQPESILRGFPFDGAALRDPETRERFLRLLIDMLKK